MTYDDWKTTESESVNWRDIPVRPSSDPIRKAEERMKAAAEELRQLDERGAK